MDPAARTAALLEAEAAGRAPKFLPFWGHPPQPDGSIGPGCLSQWWPSAFTVDGVRYATGEHWMMAGKARLFGDDVALGQVLAARSPGAAKAAGRPAVAVARPQPARVRPHGRPRTPRRRMTTPPPRHPAGGAYTWSRHGCCGTKPSSARARALVMSAAKPSTGVLCGVPGNTCSTRSALGVVMTESSLAMT